jgi:hypothetical protein
MDRTQYNLSQNNLRPKIASDRKLEENFSKVYLRWEVILGDISFQIAICSKLFYQKAIRCYEN